MTEQSAVRPEFSAPRDGTKRPSVLFVTRSYPPSRGGMEQLSYDLTTSVATRTHTHIVANRRGKRFLPLFLLVGTIRALFRAGKYDVVHLGDPVLSVVGWILKRVHGQRTRMTMTVHGLDIVFPSKAYQWYLRTFLLSADLHICISTYVERMLRERFPKARTLVIPPGIHDLYFQPGRTRQDLANILGSDIGKRSILLTVGRLVPRKGVPWFIEHVLPTLPDNVLYVVVGGGPARESAERMAREKDVSDRVRFLGAVSDETLRTLYNTADLFLMPNIELSNDPEGFGLVALQAASCKRPVVAFALQGIVDAVTDGQNGVLVTPGDANAYVREIRYLLDHPEERKRLGEHARIFTLQHFSWTRIAERYLDAFITLRSM